MMQPNQSQLSVNLGKNKESTTTGYFLKWAVNTGRIILVTVELITLGALGYRFIVDRQIVDLHDQIQNALLLVNSQAKSETLFRNLQGRLNTIQTLETETQAKVNFLKEIISLLNTNEFISSNLSVSDASITIDGQTYSVFTLNTLIDKLKTNPNVISISIDDLTSFDQGIKFKLTTQLKPSSISLQ
ncbi:MAG: hypothetical protein ACHQT7_01880 [Candidatus Levyibacteriota bacterium]